jgi:hypothetical protein
MDLWRRLLGDLRHGENIDAYVTVVAAIVLSGLSIVNIGPPGGLSGVILAVLALLAIGTLVTRHRLEALARDTDKSSLPQFPVGYGPDYESALFGDGDIYLQGVSLNGTITWIIHALERRLRLGFSVRVLLINPTAAAIYLAEDRMGVPADYKRREFQTNSSLSHLGRLANEIGGRLEIRLTDQELSFGASAIQVGTSQAVIYLQYYAYSGDRHELPLVIKPSDGQWYDFHLMQAEALWERAVVWTPRTSEAPDAVI